MNVAAPSSLGERASLELQLQDTQRDLERLVGERGELYRQADVSFALACEPGAQKVRHNLDATDKRLKAFLLSGQIGELMLRVKNLQSRLKSAPAQVAPVVLTAAQCADMDDTHNFHDEVAA